MAAEESPLPLPDRLRQAIEEAGISQRELARRIIARLDDTDQPDPRRVENERRQLAKYLAGQHAPERTRAELLSQLLEKPVGYFVERDEVRLRLIDQIRGLADGLDDLTALVMERLPEEDEEGDAGDVRAIARRLGALEATVAEQGEAQIKALKALTAGIRKLERQLTPEAPSASQGEAAQ